MILSGSELVGYIKQQQTQRAGALTTTPKLVILRADSSPVTDVFMRLKQRYGEEVGSTVEVHQISQEDLLNEIKQINADKGIHGIVVQLPLPDMSRVDELVDSIESTKDVDGLGKNAKYDSATATAILWLLAGYNVDLAGKCIVIVGQGKLVGAPLTKILRDSGHEVITCDEHTKNLAGEVQQAEILISATGSPRLIKNEWIQPGAVVIDAGTTSEQGEIVGDVHESARERDDIKITPIRGGVGPLTIAVLFDHLIRAAELTSK